MAMTIEEVAGRLNIPVETVYRWVRQGKIPMQHSGGQYTIHQVMFEHWVEEHQLKVHSPACAMDTCSDNQPDDLVLPAIKTGGVFYNVTGDSSESLLASAVEMIPNIQDDQRPVILSKLLEREQLASTGIGYGIALPHPRTNPDLVLARPQITTCFAAQPVPFEAIDHKPVTVIMVLLSNTTKEHLSLLSRLAFFLRDAAFRDRLLAAPPPKAIFDLIAGMESTGQ
jgi:PTS system nitrogen regulatory IIA component